MSYEVLKNRLTNGKPFTLEAATERINALADSLEITQEQATELLQIATENASNEALSYDERLKRLEAASLEHDAALMELAGLLMGGSAK